MQIKSLFGYDIDNIEISQNDKDLLYIATCKVDEKTIKFYMRYCPSQRDNLGYTNYYLFSFGIKVNYLHIFDVMINNDIREKVYNSYKKAFDPKNTFHEYINDYAFAIETLKMYNPFFDYFNKFAAKDSEDFVVQMGL